MVNVKEIRINGDKIEFEDNDLQATRTLQELSDGKYLKTDSIAEKTAATGVTVDGALLKDNSISVDGIATNAIAEKISAAGIIIYNSVKLKNADVCVNQLDQSGAVAYSLANNGTWQPFGATAVFSGFFIVNNYSSGSIGIFTQGGGVITAVSVGAFGVAKDTASKINIYLETNVVTLQNKVGSAQSLQIFSIRTRAGA